MSNDREIAKRVAQILRILAEKVETNPELLKDIEPSFIDAPARKRKEKIEESPEHFDVFEIYATGGEKALLEALDPLELKALKKIISQHGFDPSKLAEKWRTKERLVKLIAERVAARSDKGKVFKQYP
jgi:hypothetical protein